MVSFWCWVVIVAGIGFFCGYVYRWRGVPFVGAWRSPFVGRAPQYAIGVRVGSSPSDLADPPGATNPVLTADAVTDVRAAFVADPFLFRHGDDWIMFMEVMNRARHCGEIGHALSTDGVKWSYRGIVLREPFHLSYPCILEDRGEIWMIPETAGDNSVRLYRATEFPAQWRFVTRLIEGFSFTDASVFQHGDSWWMFVSRNRSEDLLLYYADALTGPWCPHPRSPVVYARPEKARCAGRPIHLNGWLIRFAQDCKKEYGTSVRAFRIDRLDRQEYLESEMEDSAILHASGRGWNESGMHHIDFHVCADGPCLAAVDGWRMTRAFGWKY